MLAQLAGIVIALIEELLPLIGGSSSGITTILNALTQIVPLVIQEAADLLPAIKNIIAALIANSTTTAAQIAALQALDAQVDAAFEAAATAAGDPAPPPATPPAAS
jgi:hypothetical protein